MQLKITLAKCLLYISPHNVNNIQVHRCGYRATNSTKTNIKELFFRVTETNQQITLSFSIRVLLRGISSFTLCNHITCAFMGLVWNSDAS